MEYNTRGSPVLTSYRKHLGNTLKAQFSGAGKYFDAFVTDSIRYHLFQAHWHVSGLERIIFRDMPVQWIQTMRWVPDIASNILLCSKCRVCCH